MMGKKVLFIHHSTGGNLIKEGKLRYEIKKIDSSIQFWDHSYNLSPIFTRILSNFTHLRGLTNSEGTITGKDYNLVLSNNSPKEYADIFSKDPNNPTLKSILEYDVIVFKNCYPTTRIASEKQLQEDIKYYKIIGKALKKYPSKKFILMTPPPARKETTNSEKAFRAKKLVTWLKSKEFLQNSSNFQVFDFFGLLADVNGYLKKEYTRLLPWDSHPNKRANRTIAPIFAKYLVNEVIKN